MDAMEMGADVTRGGLIVHNSTGSFIQSIGRSETRKFVNNLDADDAKSAAIRLEKIMSQRASLAEVLEEEKWASTAGLLAIFSKPDWRKQISPFSCPPNKLDDTLRWLSCNKRRIVNNYMAQIDKEIAAVRNPYRCYKAPPMSKDETVEIVMPIVGSAYFYQTKSECLNRLLLVELSLRAYKLEHGTYPANLSDLAPDYLKKLPDDSFSLSGTFKYRLSDNSYTLYSIGPDGKDDLGKPVFNPSKKGSLRYHVGRESKGDIVAGINR